MCVFHGHAWHPAQGALSEALCCTAERTAGAGSFGEAGRCGPDKLQVYEFPPFFFLVVILVLRGWIFFISKGAQKLSRSPAAGSWLELLVLLLPSEWFWARSAALTAACCSGCVCDSCTHTAHVSWALWAQN